MRRLRSLIFLCLALPGWADTVLVLPFFNESSTANLDWIGESVAHTVSEALLSRGLLVLDREDREEVYRRLSIRPNAHLTHASVIKVAEALDSTQVIYGEFDVAAPAPGAAGTPGVSPSRGTVRITAYTLDMTRMRKGPDLMESGALEDLAQLQAHLAWQVLRFLAPDLTPSAEQFLSERPPVRLDAMENYTRGLLASSDEQKHRYFTQAVRLDERFAQPQFELGKLHWAKKEYRLAADWLARVKPSGPRYFESVPLNEVFNDLGAAQSRRNLPAALDNFQKALEGDPADPDFHFNVGYALWKRGEFAAAADSFRAVLQRSQDDPQATLMLGRCLAKTPPRATDPSAGLERVKSNYEEGAYRQLKAALESKQPK
jgi:tetratricopeptide (TPR) repeat protein